MLLIVSLNYGILVVRTVFNDHYLRTYVIVSQYLWAVLGFLFFSLSSCFGSWNLRRQISDLEIIVYAIYICDTE